MNTIIELTKSYIFCDHCGKCYIYKGSYEKHNMICLKKIENTNQDTITEQSINIESIDKYEKNNDFLIDYNVNKYNQSEQLIEILCPIYLFIICFILGLIKGIILGF